MKKFLPFILLIFLFTNTGISQFNFAAGAQLLFDGSVFGIQGKALYTVDDTWRGAGSFTLHLETGVDWTIDLDAHYMALEINDNFNLSPMAGLGITRYGVAGFSDTEIGINLGAFIDFPVGETLTVYVEPKINLGGYDSFGISGGVMF